MASQDVEDVKAIVVEISNSPLPVSAQSDLQDNEKTWLVVGICLHSVISPVLRRFVDPVITNLYTQLKIAHKIDIQIHPNVLQKYPLPPAPYVYNLNYESINNNRQHGKNKKLFDYTVNDPVDLSKLFVLPHMAHYTGFNETCDSSALLGLILNIDKFQQPLKLVADQVRKEIRNVWAHCDFQVWDQIKFLQVFQLMEQLVRNLQLPYQEEIDTIAVLTKWQCTGHQFLSGTTLGLELLREIKIGEASLAKYILHIDANLSNVDSDMNKANDALTRIDNDLMIVIAKTEKLEEEQSRMEASIDEVTKKQQTLEDNVDQYAKEQKNLTEGFSNLDVELERVKNEGTKTKKTLTKRVDRLTLNVNQYRSFVRPFLTFFHTPDRMEYFEDRTDQLQQIADGFCEDELTPSIQVLCGIGGSGKTSLAIEYSWLMQRYYEGGIFWISAADNVTLEKYVRRLALDVNTLGNDSRETFSLTLKWLGNRSSNWLLVVDNVDQEELSSEMKDLLMGTWKRCCKGHILVTTRREPNEVEETLNVERTRCIYVCCFL